MEWIDKEGLRFECTRCGACCSQSGYVWVTPREIRAIAERLGLEVNEFGKKYLVKVGSRYSIGETESGRCLLLGDDNRCTIYDLRPRQCRSFPFWRSSLKSRQAWESLKGLSPGIGVGPRYSIEEILEILHGDGAAEEATTDREDRCENEAP